MYPQFILLALAFAGVAQGNVDSAGFESFGGVKGSYRLHRERVSWNTANRICQLEGGHLIVINSEDEAAITSLLFGRIAAFDPPLAWRYDLIHVGITDKAKEGEWVTVLGGKVSDSGYNVWRKGEPNNYRKAEHCGAISRVMEYSDLRCNAEGHLVPFICEKEPSEGDEAIDIRIKETEKLGEEIIVE